MGGIVITEEFAHTLVKLRPNGQHQIWTAHLPENVIVEDIVVWFGAYNAITLWDRPGGFAGHTISFTSTGNANLGDFYFDATKPWLGTWDHAVRSYVANNTEGSFAGGTPTRHEHFGLNYDVVDAGRVAQVAGKIYITFVGAEGFLEPGSIVSGIGAEWQIFPIGLLGGSTANGTPVVIGADERWHYDSATGALVHVNSGKCIEIAGDGNHNGQKLQLGDRTGTANQRWGYDEQLHQWYNAVGAGGRCIDIPGGNTAANTQLQIWDRIGGDLNQFWRNYFYRQ
jgi:hypothetical protein